MAIFLCGLATVFLPSSLQAAEKYPSRPIELIVPSPIGGGTDMIARLIAEEIQPFLGTKMIVVNKDGGGATIGTTYLVQSKPDGYTLAAVWNNPLTVMPHSVKVHYTADSYLPVARLTSGAEGLCSRVDFPANSAKEWIEVLKANPNKYVYGNDGVGGKMQLAVERVVRHFGVKLRSVPFGGGGAQMKALLGEHVDFFTGSFSIALPYIKSGKVKCLLVFSAEDSVVVPTAWGLTKLGVPQEETAFWRGIIAPKELPDDRLKVLQEAFRKVLVVRRVREFVESAGEKIDFARTEEFSNQIKKEFNDLGEVRRSLDLPTNSQ
jgi:tripartite-type tricarboxylate transporter receptor subunit TctC